MVYKNDQKIFFVDLAKLKDLFMLQNGVKKILERNLLQRETFTKKVLWKNILLIKCLAYAT